MGCQTIKDAKVERDPYHSNTDNSLIRHCPDSSFTNSMPGSPSTTTYYCDGKTYPPSAFDNPWVREVCDFKTLPVY